MCDQPIIISFRNDPVGERLNSPGIHDGSWKISELGQGNGDKYLCVNPDLDNENVISCSLCGFTKDCVLCCSYITNICEPCLTAVLPHLATSHCGAPSLNRAGHAGHRGSHHSGDTSGESQLSQ